VINSSLLISSNDNSGNGHIKDLNERIEALKEHETIIVKEQSEVSRYKTYNALESVTEIQKITNKLPKDLQLNVFKADFSAKDQKILNELMEPLKRKTRSSTKSKTSTSDSPENSGSTSVAKKRKTDDNDDGGLVDSDSSDSNVNNDD